MLNMENGEIHIGASDMTLRFYLLPLLQKFHEEYPGIHLVVTNGPTPETVRYLNEGKIDFGLVTAPLGKQKGFEITGNEFTRIPNDLKDVNDEQRAVIEKIVERLEEDDDVQNVYTNMRPVE
mgnify:CR=1 FL=1